jgi:hypothetical protein
MGIRSSNSSAAIFDLGFSVLLYIFGARHKQRVMYVKW